MINPYLINSGFLLHFVDTTASTNLLLNEMVENNRKMGNILPDFYGVVANYQTIGRGQGKKTWQSNKGENLLVSLYFQPQIVPSQQIYFNYFFALTVRRVISKYVNDVKIKKPNDIWVGEKKIAGILIEHLIQGDKLTYTIAGVGININQTQFDASLPNPTSLKIITNKNLSRELILEEIIETGKWYYQKLQDRAFEELKEEYEESTIVISAPL
ncbi:MAG: biotin--[acetyl-CoA-carboxylase] ligase [Bacteroidales bacterium]|jgi:BirA family biotin operon repressor/biotin-[acetyl-CoA-carboxylase] ligase|nr:biotin--[acetyl-CoA-carboxylase] ligase [Bacteroidales bacterium]